MSRRITEGVFDGNNEKFIVVDDWKNQRDAHRRLEQQWTGTTTFQKDPARIAMDGSGESTAVKNEQRSFLESAGVKND